MNNCNSTLTSDDSTIVNDERDDAVWILTSSFIIFTMQSGFGLLESGFASPKSEVNIMVKNMMDVVFGGSIYWMFGYGLSFGSTPGYTNPVIGTGSFFADGDTNPNPSIGGQYASFFFLLSFCTTSSTIVSGALAERTPLKSYIVLTIFTVLIHSFPAHWIWSSDGFLKQLGVMDSAGASVVHLVGGTIGLVATVLLKPRTGRFDDSFKEEMGSPTNALLGTFLLWWGWLGFNCGSTWGIAKGKWHSAARAAVSTITASMGGGVTATILRLVAYSTIVNLKQAFCGFSYSFTRKLRISWLISGILGSLVSVTGMCAVARPWYSFLIGATGSGLAIGAAPLLVRMKIDDPVGVVPVHMVCGFWGMTSAGLFAEPAELQSSFAQGEYNNNHYGLMLGGNPYFFGLQMLAVVIVVLWAATTSSTVMLLLKFSPIGFRYSKEDEELGADLYEHGLASRNKHQTEHFVMNGFGHA